MKLEQSFEVAAPLERVWKTLIDVEHVAPCLPGAAVTGRNDDGSYNGTFTVKIGPTTASYSGKLEMESIDEASHTATMQAQGTDKRGQGGAKATIYSRLAPADGRGTRVEVVTDYHITGRLARFGRGGMIEDISERLLREFAKRLQSSLACPSRTRSCRNRPRPSRRWRPRRGGARGGGTRAPRRSRPASPRPRWVRCGEPEVPPRDETVFAPAPTESAPPRGPRVAAASPPRRSRHPPGASASRRPRLPLRSPSAVAPARVAEPVGRAGGRRGAATATAGAGSATGGDPAAGTRRRPATRPPLQHPPEPSEPMQGLSLVGAVVWGRVKRNPAPAPPRPAWPSCCCWRARRRRHH